jgi:predicted RecB family nuclease
MHATLKQLATELLKELKEISSRNAIPEEFFSKLEKFDAELGTLLKSQSAGEAELKEAHILNNEVLTQMAAVKEALLKSNSHFLKKKGGVRKYIDAILGK